MCSQPHMNVKVNNTPPYPNNSERRRPSGGEVKPVLLCKRRCFYLDHEALRTHPHVTPFSIFYYRQDAAPNQLRDPSERMGPSRSTQNCSPKTLYVSSRTQEIAGYANFPAAQTTTRKHLPFCASQQNSAMTSTPAYTSLTASRSA
jgi:hypothetical protein